MGQFPKALHPFHPSHPSFVLLPFLGLLRSPPFSWPCVCSVGFGGWRVRPVITWSLMVSRKPIPAASYIFEMTLKHMGAWIGDRKLFWKYVKKYRFDVRVSFYHRKLLLTNKIYSITPEKQSHAFLYLLCLFPKPQSKGDLDMALQEWLFLLCCCCALFKICGIINVLQLFYFNTLWKTHLQHCCV